ncbi:MAG: manganese catalase family protein [Anaerovoracaceae bacterium]|nr:manganese catalase family protein [Anaerovoracaceae bacterium]
MWTYERTLEYPVKISKPDAKAAKIILSAFGGSDGELGASQRYLSQRYSMPYKQVAGLLTDIGTEELAHMEMVCAIIHQLTRDLSLEQIEEQGFAPYFVEHTLGLYPENPSGHPWSAATFQSKGDAITDLCEDMAAEQKARSGYDNLLRLIENPEVRDPLKFLREREIVHFQRFGEALRNIQDGLDSKNFYFINPEFDRKGPKKCGMKEASKADCGCRMPEMSKDDCDCRMPEMSKDDCGCRMSETSKDDCSCMKKGYK